MFRAAIATALLLAVPAVVRAEEAALAEARTELDGVEKDLAGLKAGDAAGANAIIVRINEAIVKLNGCKEKTEDWKAQGKRAKDLDTKARNLASGKAPAGPVEPDETTLQAKDELDAVAKDLEALGAGDAAGANALVKRINGVRDLLGKSSRDKRNAPLWKDCAARCMSLDKDVRARAAASAEWPDLDKLGRDDKYAFTSQFQPVFEDTTAQLAAGSPRALASEWRAKRFTDALARMRTALGKIGDQENAAVKQATAKVGEMETSWKAKVEEGKRLLEKDAAEAEAAAQDVDARLANDAWATDALAKVRSAAATAEAVAAFTKEWLGTDDAEAAKAAADFTVAAGKIEAGATQALAAARMPPARSTDETLLATAKEVLSDPAVGAGEFRRTVVNAALQSHEERKSEARDEGDYLRIWTWTEVWDDFQVCRAEKVGVDWRLVYYTLKYIHSGPKWLKLQKWYVRERIVSQRLLEENIDK